MPSSPFEILNAARVWKKCQPSAVNMCSSSSAASYVTPPGGVAKFSGNPIVVKEQLLQKRAGTVRGATIEEIEAEKSVIEKDAKGRMEKTLKWYDPISILLGQGGQAQPCWARLSLKSIEKAIVASDLGMDSK